jgi:hypothetical protein
VPEEAEHVAGMAVAKVVLMAQVAGAAPVGTTLIQLKMYRPRGTMLEEIRICLQNLEHAQGPALGQQGWRRPPQPSAAYSELGNRFVCDRVAAETDGTALQKSRRCQPLPCAALARREVCPLKQ